MAETFVSARHAWQAGILVGALLKKGVNVEPDTDAEGNYLATMSVFSDELPPAEMIRIHVLPPEE